MRIRKILAIMLIITIILGILQIPSARAEDTDTFTITYNANGAVFDDGSTTNTVTYDCDGNIVSGTYKEPKLNNPTESDWYWSTDLDGRLGFVLENTSQNTTVYAQFRKLIYEYECI